LEAPFAERTTAIHVSIGFSGKPLPVTGGAGKKKCDVDKTKIIENPAAWIWIVIFIAVFIYFLHLARRPTFCATDLR